jgi:anti-sigma B factor antagonist
MDFTTETSGFWTIISINSPFTIKQLSEIQIVIDKVEENDNPLLAIDLTNVPFMDSSAIGTVLTAHKKFRKKDGFVSVFGANETIQDVFTAIRLSNHLSVYTNRDDFLASC